MTGLAKSVVKPTARAMTPVYHVAAHGQNKTLRSLYNVKLQSKRNRKQVRGCVGAVQTQQQAHTCRDVVPTILQSRS